MKLLVGRAPGTPHYPPPSLVPRQAFKERVAAIWAIWYSLELTEGQAKLCAELLEALLAAGSTAEEWATGASTRPWARLIVPADNASLTAMRSEWAVWRDAATAGGSGGGKSFPPSAPAGARALWRANLEGILSRGALGPGPSSLDAAAEGLAHGVCLDIISLHNEARFALAKAEARDFFLTGSARAEAVLGLAAEPAVAVNMTLFEPRVGKFTLHYGCIPYRAFAHHFAFGPEQCRAAAAEAPFTAAPPAPPPAVVHQSAFGATPLLANSVQQLALWLASFAAAVGPMALAAAERPLAPVSTGPEPRWQFSLHVGDMLELCLQLAAPGRAASFDVITTSNVADHIGLLPILVTARPLLRPKAYLETTSLLYLSWYIGAGTREGLAGGHFSSSFLFVLFL